MRQNGLSHGTRTELNLNSHWITIHKIQSVKSKSAILTSRYREMSYRQKVSPALGPRRFKFEAVADRSIDSPL